MVIIDTILKWVRRSLHKYKPWEVPVIWIFLPLCYVFTLFEFGPLKLIHSCPLWVPKMRCPFCCTEQPLVTAAIVDLVSVFSYSSFFFFFFPMFFLSIFLFLGELIPMVFSDGRKQNCCRIEDKDEKEKGNIYCSLWFRRTKGIDGSRVLLLFISNWMECATFNAWFNCWLLQTLAELKEQESSLLMDKAELIKVYFLFSFSTQISFSGLVFIFLVKQEKEGLQQTLRDLMLRNERLMKHKVIRNLLNNKYYLVLRLFCGMPFLRYTTFPYLCWKEKKKKNIFLDLTVLFSWFHIIFNGLFTNSPVGYVVSSSFQFKEIK